MAADPARQWTPPGDVDTVYRFGTSVLEEFALSHSPVDCLRELVQNEYDAGGDELHIHFGSGGLWATGNGGGVSREGWSRLTVMMGTGDVAGEAARIAAKTNSIGSKNFGLRALFLFGNRIYVRSGGQRTFLDIERGSPPHPIPDPEWDQPRGAQIYVPFRETTTSRLPTFDQAAENALLNEVTGSFFPSLIRLGASADDKRLRLVTITAERARWTAKLNLGAQTQRDGSAAVIRRRATWTVSGQVKASTITDLEFQRALPTPSWVQYARVPAYFRVPGGRIRLGVSVRLKGPPGSERHGQCYYPLLSEGSLTGCGWSINAPFEMDQDRSAIVSPDISAWNRWLLESAAQIVLDVLGKGAFSRIGADAYAACAAAGTNRGTEPFLAHLEEGLRSNVCWPTRTRTLRGASAQLAKAGDLNAPDRTDLDGFLSDSQLLATTFLKNERALSVAAASGSRRFTLSSLIRLRCAGADASGLSTKIPADSKESNFHYRQFPEDLADEALQVKFAKVIDALERQLTRPNIEDLRAAPTTLTAADTLAAPSDLWVVGDELRLVGAVPVDSQLHPALAKSKVLRGLCRQYEPRAWIEAAAGRLAVGDLSEEERESLQAMLLKLPRLPRALWTELRQLPVVRDHRGEWAAPADLTSRDARGATQLESVLHFPRHELARSRVVRSWFKPRAKITSQALVAFARQVESVPELAGHVESVLDAHRGLITKPVAADLNEIAFLRSQTGNLVAPNEAYLPSDQNLACMGETVNYIAGRHRKLHELLGCRSSPRAADILNHLRGLSASGRALDRPDLVYPALCKALQRDEGGTSGHSSEPVVWTGASWVSPDDLLLGNYERLFSGCLPSYTPEALRTEFRQLGAATSPSDRHWLKLIQHIDGAADSDRTLNRESVDRLRLLYARLHHVPTGTPQAARWLLTDRQTLMSLRDAAARRYLLDDHPLVADELHSRTATIAFADLGEPSVRALLKSAGVARLSEVARFGEDSLGERRPRPAWAEQSAKALLSRFHAQAFASATRALAAEFGAGITHSLVTIRRRLLGIARVEFLESIETKVRVARTQIVVRKVSTLKDGCLYLATATSRRGIFDAAALALTELLALSESGGSPSRTRQSATASADSYFRDALFRLLECEDVREIQRYLASRRISWQFDVASEQGRFDEEPNASEADEVGAKLAEDLARRLSDKAKGRRADAPTRQEAATGERDSEGGTRFDPLPSLESLDVAEQPFQAWERRERRGGGGGGTGGARTPEQVERDRQVGRRGEEIVLMVERGRLKLLGLDQEAVEWTADGSPNADHDIRSIDSDGAPLFLEVKSTIGESGKFQWARAEFELAFRERERYRLVRVYRADTTAPIVVTLPDPVGAWLRGELHLEVDGLGGEMQPL